MKDISKSIQYKGKEYKMVFNLNVMQNIQIEFGSIDKWASLSDGSTGEPNARAVIFGIKEMINEGIDIANEENGTNDPPLTAKQVGRMITEYGLMEITKTMNDAVIESTQSDSKNA